MPVYALISVPAVSLFSPYVVHDLLGANVIGPDLAVLWEPEAPPQVTQGLPVPSMEPVPSFDVAPGFSESSTNETYFPRISLCPTYLNWRFDHAGILLVLRNSGVLLLDGEWL